MNRTFITGFSLATYFLAAGSLRADVLQCAGILGNSGEQGSSLVRFGTAEASGLGVVCDRYGSLWDRAGAGVLNRYSPDGRLLATYRLPDSQPNRSSDAIALTGENVLLRLGKGLYSLPLDAPSGTAAKPMNVAADWMSPSAQGGWVAAATANEVFLVNAAGERKPVAILKTNVQGLELGPDGVVYVQDAGGLSRVDAAAPIRVGPLPGERPQFLAGSWFGSGWHSTVRRFDAALNPAPGVVLGGNSGSFIGHVDEQSEIVNGRGLAQVNPNLFAISGLSGVMHLLQWSHTNARFTPVRRIGAVPQCAALGLDRDGRVWYGSGSWQWSDGPATPLRYGIPAGQVFTTTMLDSDVMVAYAQLHSKPALIYGKLDSEMQQRHIEKAADLPGEAVAIVATEFRKRRALLVLTKKGQATVVYIGANGSYESDAGTAELATATPVREWTALAAAGRDGLIGAGDGFVIELARDGDNWRETRRWNSWGQNADEKFGANIWLSAAGRLWVADATRHRVLCFDPATRRPLAFFGSVDVSGDSLSTLNTPRTLTANVNKAVVFDSGNQRVVKLELHATKSMGQTP